MKSVKTPFFLKPINLFFIVFLCHFTSIIAQETKKKDSLYQPKKEIRLDIFQLVILPGFDFSYERFIDEVSSWGISGFINFDKDFDEGYRSEHFELSPYYRLYFTERKRNNSGFFVQPFLSLISAEHETYDDRYDPTLMSYVYRTETHQFLGISGGALLGYKWVNKKRYSFEIHFGVGRYLILNKDSVTDETAYPRINFSIGRQF